MQVAGPLTRYIVPVAAAVLILLVGVLASPYLGPQKPPSSSTGTVDIVAAENFWGSLASQLGGMHAHVTSIVSDPNVDPHEYVTTPADGIAITNAQLVVVNGAGYDAWALDLISAEHTPGQLILNVQELVDQSVDSNPHFWYSPYYVNDTVAVMYRDLVKIDPADTSYFHQQYIDLNSSLWQSFMKQEASIKDRYSDVPVASTESVFVYLANATGLDVVSPPAFMNAVAQGNDPPAQSLAQFENLLAQGNSSVRVLVYNEQTVTPLVEKMKTMAAQYGIPVVGMTEVISPADSSFQLWMQTELAELAAALGTQAQGGR